MAVNKKLEELIELLRKMPPIEIDRERLEAHAAKELGSDWREQVMKAAHFFGLRCGPDCKFCKNTDGGGE